VKPTITPKAANVRPVCSDLTEGEHTPTCANLVNEDASGAGTQCNAQCRLKLYNDSNDEIFNQPISTEALANLTGLTDLIHKEVERSSPGLIGSLFGSSTAAAPATGSSTTAVQAAGAKVAITTPDQKHKELMEIMTKINLTLQGMSTIEDSQLRVMRTGFNQVSGTVY
jgi:hypothetical protein